jgi:hypothetical protein
MQNKKSMLKKLLYPVIVVYLILYQVLIFQYFENHSYPPEFSSRQSSASQIIFSCNNENSLIAIASQEVYKINPNELSKYDTKSAYIFFKQNNLFLQELFFVIKEHNDSQNHQCSLSNFLLRSPPILLS